MRKPLIWLALAVCLLAPVARAAELVPNGGFEEMKRSDLVAGLDPETRKFYGGIADSPFQGWAFGAQWEQGEYLVAVSGDAHSGKHSCQITCRKKGRGGIASSPIGLPAKNDFDWTEVVGTVTVPKPKKTGGEQVDIHVFIYIRTYGELWMDDVTLATTE